MKIVTILFNPDKAKKFPSTPLQRSHSADVQVLYRNSLEDTLH